MERNLPSIPQIEVVSIGSSSPSPHCIGVCHIYLDEITVLMTYYFYYLKLSQKHFSML